MVRQVRRELVHRGPQPERALVLPFGLGVAEHGGRGRTCGRRCAQRPRQVAGPVPVVGQLGGRTRLLAQPQPGMRRQRLGEAAVAVRQLTGQQLGVHGVPGQRVREGVALTVVDDQQLRGDALAQRQQQLFAGQWAGRGDQRVGGRPPGGGHDARHLPRAGADRVQPRQDQVPDPDRDRPVHRGIRGDELPGEERVALGPPDDRVDHLPSRGAAEQGRHQLVHVRRGQRGQLVPPAPPGGHELGQGAPQLRGGPGPVADHDEHALVGQRPREEQQQVQGGSVDPVHVLDDQHGGCLLRAFVEQPQHRVQELHRRALAQRPVAGDAGGQRRQQPGQLGPARTGEGPDGGCAAFPDQRPQPLHQWQERQRAGAEVQAAAAQHGAAAVAGAPAELREQAALAHARLAAEQHQARVAACGRLQRLLEQRQLRGPADQGSGQGGGHLADSPRSAGAAPIRSAHRLI